jgi:DNA-binding response OmpR family regulator
MAMQKILIIEDETDLQEAIHARLVTEGYEVRTANSSEEGLKQVLTEKPDLILLDIMTHSLHGSVFVQRLRGLSADKNDSKVIVLTNLDNDISKNKFSDGDIFAYLVKADTSLDQITNKVAAALSS